CHAAASPVATLPCLPRQRISPNQTVSAPATGRAVAACADHRAWHSGRRSCRHALCTSESDLLRNAYGCKQVMAEQTNLLTVAEPIPSVDCLDRALWHRVDREHS